MTAMMRPTIVALFRYTPTLVILGLLGGLALLGHRTEWKIDGLAKLWSEEQKSNDEANRTHVDVDPCTPALACGLGYVVAREKERVQIVFPSAEAVTKTGLETKEVETRPMEQHVTAVGELDFDRTQYAVLAPRVPGTVWHVFVEPGKTVKRGDLLSLVETAEVGRAKTEFLNSLVQVERRTDTLRDLEATSGLIPVREIREARASLREARIKLFNDHQALVNLGLDIAWKDVQGLSEEAAFNKVSSLGVPESLRRGTPQDGMTANLLPLTAPFDGVIVSMRKAKGEAVSPTEPQFILADLSKLWLMLNVRPDEAEKLKLGQDVFFRPTGMDKDVQGKLTWISPEVDEKTRVVMARAAIANADGNLRPRTFGAGRILIEKNPNALTVPDEAVQTDEGTSYVFVRSDETVFQARRVEIGPRQNGFTVIVHGVSAGEMVVTKGSHVLKSEWFKDRIGGDDE